MSRATGDTFRHMLRILEHCSATPDRHVLFLFPHRRPLEHAMRRTADLLFVGTIDYFTIKSNPTRKIILQNGSTIWFRTNEFLTREDGWRGIEWTMLVEDGSIFDAYHSPGYREMVKLIGRRIQDTLSRGK